MAEVEEKKKRSANFSTADCLLLAEIMGSEYGMEGLTFHAYTKHRFTNSEYHLLIFRSFYVLSRPVSVMLTSFSKQYFDFKIKTLKCIIPIYLFLYLLYVGFFSRRLIILPRNRGPFQ